MSKLKQCNSCKQWKTLDSFHRHDCTKDRLQTKCKECYKKIWLEKKDKNKFYETEKPVCKCGGKVVISPQEKSAGAYYKTMIYVCLGCLKELGEYKETGLSPERLMRAMYEDQDKYDFLTGTPQRMI